MGKRPEKFHIMRPWSRSAPNVRETLCGQNVSRQRLVGAHNGQFYIKSERGYPTVDASKVCGNCKRIFGIKE